MQTQAAPKQTIREQRTGSPAKQRTATTYCVGQPAGPPRQTQRINKTDLHVGTIDLPAWGVISWKLAVR